MTVAGKAWTQTWRACLTLDSRPSQPPPSPPWALMGSCRLQGDPAGAATPSDPGSMVQAKQVARIPEKAPRTRDTQHGLFSAPLLKVTNFEWFKLANSYS